MELDNLTKDLFNIGWFLRIQVPLYTEEINKEVFEELFKKLKGNIDFQIIPSRQTITLSYLRVCDVDMEKLLGLFKKGDRKDKDFMFSDLGPIRVYFKEVFKKKPGNDISSPREISLIYRRKEREFYNLTNG